MKYLSYVSPLIGLLGGSVVSESSIDLLPRSCNAGIACHELEVEMEEDELASQMQVELLQRSTFDIRSTAWHKWLDGHSHPSKKSLGLVEAAKAAAVEVKSNSEAQEAGHSETAKPVASTCNLDHLVGNWTVENALGIDGVTVKLLIQARQSKECSHARGTIHFLGKTSMYTISSTDSGTPGKLHVKFLNEEASPVYFHEGEYDIAKDLLTEDLGAVNGKKLENGAQILAFSRLNRE
eukprot:TRINITY_DN17715_c0_g1_i1.p1 TRINITY_DN17715_c0_g1~~TRINITY_DN17715_c0_g1_i1.p1  ORF type:complete len:237 (-),score=48.52 TRINITY_DN17715_c0_g1_i1:67-777(-)